MIRKRSEHGLGHLLNPLDPDTDDRDWIRVAYDLIITDIDLVAGGGGPDWLDLPALTKIAITTNEVAKAFAGYNEGRSWAEQIRPFNFLLHAHHSSFTTPTEADHARFRLVASYENNPALWLSLPWIDLGTGQRHRVATTGIPSPDVVLLKTYREVLLRYAIHPEPKSLDPNGNPTSRRSPPGLLHRRPVTMLTLSLIGKESNRLDETIAGLIGSQDNVLLSYGDPGLHVWNTLIAQALNDFPCTEVAKRGRLDTRTIQRIKTRAITKPHDRNRAVLTLITAQLATERIESWGLAVPASPLEQIAFYVDHREEHSVIPGCVVCGGHLDGRQRCYCGERCRKSAYRSRIEAREGRGSTGGHAGADPGPRLDAWET